MVVVEIYVGSLQQITGLIIVKIEKFLSRLKRARKAILIVILQNLPNTLRRTFRSFPLNQLFEIQWG